MKVNKIYFTSYYPLSFTRNWNVVNTIDSKGRYGLRLWNSKECGTIDEFCLRHNIIQDEVKNNGGTN